MCICTLQKTLMSFVYIHFSRTVIYIYIYTCSIHIYTTTEHANKSIQNKQYVFIPNYKVV